MGNLCSDEQEEEDQNFESLLQRTIAQLKCQLNSHVNNVKVETDLSLSWTRKYKKYIESLEELLKQARLDRTLSELPNPVNVEYELHEYPIVCEMDRINLPIAPQSVL